MKLIPRRQDDWGEQKVEKELVVKADCILDECTLGQLYDQSSDHTCLIVSIKSSDTGDAVLRSPTCENGQNRLMYRLNLLML
jgi:hypothetical protein